MKIKITFKNEKKIEPINQFPHQVTTQQLIAK
jgi:hypothetical protein